MNQDRDRMLDQLLAYLEDELPAEARAAVEEQLAQDAALRQELEALQTVTGDLADLGAVYQGNTPAVDLLDGVFERVRLHEDLAGDALEEDLLALEQDLFALAHDANSRVPVVDLVAGIEQRVNSFKTTASGAISDEDALIAALDDAYETGGIGNLPSVLAHPDLRDQGRDYERLIVDLDQIGRGAAARVPEIDLADQVLSRVHELAALKNVVPLRRASLPTVSESGQPAGRWRRIVLPLAAAAALAMLVWPAAQRLIPSPTSTENMARVSDPATSNPGDVTTMGAVEQPNVAESERDPGLEGTAPEDQISVSRRKSLTAQDVLNEKRAQLFGPESAKNRLQLLASLTQDQVREMIAKNDLDLNTLLGAVKYLPREEAIAVLLDQLANNPENPYLRYALANEMGSDPNARAQLAAWTELDPGNALPYYMDARILLEQGDLEGALALLQQAADLDQAYPYSLLSARYHEQALLASGMDPDAARLLAATTGGSGEYTQLTGLAQQILQYGEYYESIGDFETAQALYNAAHNFGLQLDQGSAFANERLAALETQHDALGSLQGLYEMLGNEQNVQVMLESLQILSAGLNELYSVFDQQNQIFNNSDLSTLLTIAGTILLSGDLNLF